MTGFPGDSEHTEARRDANCISHSHTGLRACDDHSTTAICSRLRGFLLPCIAQLRAVEEACRGSLGGEEQSQAQCSRRHVPDAFFQDHCFFFLSLAKP